MIRGSKKEAPVEAEAGEIAPVKEAEVEIAPAKVAPAKVAKKEN